MYRPLSASIVFGLCLTLGLQAAEPRSASKPTLTPQEKAQLDFYLSKPRSTPPTNKPARMPDVQPRLAKDVPVTWPTEPVRITTDKAPTDEAFFLHRMLQHAMVPQTGTKDPAEDQALAVALFETVAPAQLTPKPLRAFLKKYPQSRWRLAVLLNLGYIERRHGFFERALAAWKESYTLGKDAAKGSNLRALADQAATEHVGLLSRAGAFEKMDKILPELEKREMMGLPAQQLAVAIEQRKQMEADPGLLHCGSYAVGAMVRNERGPQIHEPLEQILKKVIGKATKDAYDRRKADSKRLVGSTLREVVDVGRALGTDLKAVKRTPGAEIPLPAIVHLNIKHFVLIDRKEGNLYHFNEWIGNWGGNGDQWISAEALDESLTGYVIVPQAAKLDQGKYTDVQKEDLDTVWGRGPVGGQDDKATTPCDKKNGGGCPGGAKMLRHAVHLNRVSLNLMDEPIGYEPPYGPSVTFSVSYNEKETVQAAIADRSNLGPQWAFGWYGALRVTSVSSNQTSLELEEQIPGGGGVNHTLYRIESSTQYRANSPHRMTGGIPFIDLATGTGEVAHNDGSKIVFGHKVNNGNTSLCYMTAIIDQHSNTLQIVYSAKHRIVQIIDALNEVTTLTYLSDVENTTEYFRISSITDPWLRTAQFRYEDTPSRRLLGIRDQIGYESTVVYGSDGTVQKYTTPYGDHTMNHPVGFAYQWIEITDPQGDRERVEINYADGVNPNAPPNEFPSIPVLSPGDPNIISPNIGLSNGALNYRNTFSWDKKAMRHFPDQNNRGQYNYATVYHWLHTPNNFASRLLESVKEPDQTVVNSAGDVVGTGVTGVRTWFLYPGQTNPIYENNIISYAPSKVARLTENGLELSMRTFNIQGQVEKVVQQVINPINVNDVKVNREIRCQYHPNNIDLKTVTRSGTMGETYYFGAYKYDNNHRVTDVWDESGQRTSVTYDSKGYPTEIRVPRRAGQTVEKVTFGYDTLGRLTTVTDMTGAVSRFGYDSYHRMVSNVSPEGYSVQTTLDAMDRPVVTSFPDGTFEQVVWDKFDPSWIRDRQGQWTGMTYNALRQVVGTVDTEGRMNAFVWCRCGSLKKLIDSFGNITSWNYDLKGNMVKKIYPSVNGIGSKFEDVVFEAKSGRFKSFTDSMGQVTSYSYGFTDEILGITQTNVVPHTPVAPQNWTYDSFWGRPETYTDGVGITRYGYSSHLTSLPDLTASPDLVIPTTGLGRLISVDGPLPDNANINDIMRIESVDEWGRVINASFNFRNSTVQFDAQGRVTQSRDFMGTWALDYVNALTGRVNSIQAPNGVKTSFEYGSMADGFRVKGFQHNLASGNLLARHDYTYTKNGLIDSWRRQSGAMDQTWTMRYDRTGQLMGVKATGSDPFQSTYTYDLLGNRTSNTVSKPSKATTVSGGAFNALNQVMALTGNTGAMRVEGQSSEAGQVTVTLNDPTGKNTTKTMKTDAKGNFGTEVDVTPGTKSLTIAATDASGNTRTNTYDVKVDPGTVERSFTYDFNGNCLTDGQRTYTWDSSNRIKTMTYANGDSTEFTYNGAGQRVLMKEFVSGNPNPVSVLRYVWLGSKIVEQRDEAGTTLFKRYHGQGVEICSGARTGKYFYSTDHLGSVREITDVTGRVVLARFDYDPWGNRVQVAGDPAYVGVIDEVGFTGHFWHAKSGLWLTWFRGYDAGVGRWVSRDPRFSANLYNYVNNPIQNFDTLGLFDVTWDIDIWWTSPGRVNDWVNPRVVVIKAHLEVLKTKRLKELIEEVQQEINLISKNKPCKLTEKETLEVIDNLRRLKEKFTKLQEKLESNISLTISIYDDRSPTADGGRWYYFWSWIGSPKIAINLVHGTKDSEREYTDKELFQALFHELLHEVGTDDGESDLWSMNSHYLDKFVNTKFNADTYYFLVSDKRNRECKIKK